MFYFEYNTIHKNGPFYWHNLTAMLDQFKQLLNVIDTGRLAQQFQLALVETP